MTKKVFYPKNEQFVHFLWLTQSFNKVDLRTAQGDIINILHQGHENHDAGADFSQSNITIGEITWSGSVEVHTKASDWYLHKHNLDEAYDNVVLHVVWINDRIVRRVDQSEIPTLELKNKVSWEIIMKYSSLVFNNNNISCKSFLANIEPLILRNMLDRMAVKRIESKTAQVDLHLKATRNNWEEVTFRLLCINLGFKVNTEPFTILAKSITYNMLRKYKKSIFQLEALLFGIAGLLNKTLKDPYYNRLAKEYSHLSNKHQITPFLSAHQWKFHRLRPANFPTFRIAQLAAILHHTDELFPRILNIKEIKKINACFSKELSEYWKSHFRFGKSSKNTPKNIGRSGLENIFINTVIPLLFTYGKHIDENSYCERAINFLQQIPPEHNKITRKWDALSINCQSAFDSQSLIHLYNNYCKSKQCLFCDIGKAILKKNNAVT